MGSRLRLNTATVISRSSPPWPLTTYAQLTHILAMLPPLDQHLYPEHFLVFWIFTMVEITFTSIDKAGKEMGVHRQTIGNLVHKITKKSTSKSGDSLLHI